MVLSGEQSCNTRDMELRDHWSYSVHWRSEVQKLERGNRCKRKFQQEEKTDKVSRPKRVAAKNSQLKTQLLFRRGLAELQARMNSVIKILETINI